MSSEARPISPRSFAQAIEDLPLENIYMKAQEITNSVSHLQNSNEQLQAYSDSIKNDTSLDVAVREEGDKDCLEAIAENKVVIDRQLERIALLKAEVERRGGRWHEGELVEPGENRNGAASSLVGGSNGNAGASTSSQAASGTTQRLSDDEVRRRLEERLGPLEDDGDPDAGLHL